MTPEQQRYHVHEFANRIRRGSHEGAYLGHAMIEAVKSLRCESDMYEDCRLIEQTFARDFPLIGERGSE